MCDPDVDYTMPRDCSLSRRGFLNVAPSAGAAWQLSKIFDRLKGTPSNDRTALGLQEALSVGTGHAVTRLGRIDGYFANQAVKILLPNNIRAIEAPLRMVGMGPLLDELIVTMNRAAEQAAPVARGIFIDAIKHITFSDARKILFGGDTAATEFFRDHTTGQLTLAFRPPVVEAMDTAGVTRAYSQLLAGLQKVPFVRLDKLDLTSYVVGKSLDGLFYVVGEEEKKIRHEPAAQITALLREVFGRH